MSPLGVASCHAQLSLTCVTFVIHSALFGLMPVECRVEWSRNQEAELLARVYMPNTAKVT